MTILLAVFAAVLGAVTGSFLNACIHRMPRGVSLLNPKRSFCPACEKTLPWYENLPVLSWVFLRGKCSGCGATISFRYPLVELLTAGVFLALWLKFGFPLGMAYFAFAALLLAATFIDFEHFIIPDEITLGGAALGVFLCAVIPELMGTASRWTAAGWSLLGALAGFAAVFLIVELGKIAFGRIRHRFTEPEPFRWVCDSESVTISIAGETMDWRDVFSRKKDKLVVALEGPALLDGETISPRRLEFFYDRVLLDGQPRSLESISHIEGQMSSVVIPREAMGFGDVKFMACIGAFLGWQGALFALFAGSIVGSLAGVAGLFLAKDRAGVRLPFGPFLAIGALIWLFGGALVFDWYLRLIAGLVGSFF
jgi:leader peptidase (prepilin peptidase)/N-methyltransferase